MLSAQGADAHADSTNSNPELSMNFLWPSPFKCTQTQTDNETISLPSFPPSLTSGRRQRFDCLSWKQICIPCKDMTKVRITTHKGPISISNRLSYNRAFHFKLKIYIYWRCLQSYIKSYVLIFFLFLVFFFFFKRQLPKMHIWKTC